MSIIKGDVKVNDPVYDDDVVNLGYFNNKMDEIRALLEAVVVELRETKKITKTSQLENDMCFITRNDLRNIQKDQLNTITKII